MPADVLSLVQVGHNLLTVPGLWEEGAQDDQPCSTQPVQPCHTRNKLQGLRGLPVEVLPGRQHAACPSGKPPKGLQKILPHLLMVQKVQAKGGWPADSALPRWTAVLQQLARSNTSICMRWSLQLVSNCMVCIT